MRICDAGGWTDTWFAREGLVCNLAVGPGADVVLNLYDAVGPLTLELAATDERYSLAHEEPGPGRHPLLEAALARQLPRDRHGAHIRIAAAVPPGSGTGTSAAVVVALLCALHAAREEPVDADSLAREAHDIETGLGLQSGVQDQYAAAHGGCNAIHVGPYPDASVRPIMLNDDIIDALDTQLVTVYLGQPHSSSRVHDGVIAQLERDERADERLQPLRDAAAAAAAALAAGDLAAYGAALVDNTDSQALLHPDLVSRDACALIDIARRYRAYGWKVNGAGGDGGSVTIVASNDADARQAMIDAVDAIPRWRRLPLRFARTGARATVAR